MISAQVQTPKVVIETRKLQPMRSLARPSHNQLLRMRRPPVRETASRQSVVLFSEKAGAR